MMMTKMDTLTATLYLYGGQRITAEYLKGLAYKAYASTLTNEDNLGYAGESFVVHLLDAYQDQLTAELEMTETTPVIDFVSGNEAEQIFLDNCKLGYERTLKISDSNPESYSWWPECLPLGHHYHPHVLADLGFMNGIHDGRVAIALRDAWTAMSKEATK